MVLSNNFNQPVNNFPNGLKFLKLGHNFNQSIDLLPDSINMLILGCKIFHYAISKFPNSLTHLVLPKKYKSCLIKSKLDNLDNLVYLQYGRNFDAYIYVLPNSIKYLILNKNLIDQVNKSNLPNTFKYLKLGNKYSHFLDNLPQSIQYLKLGNKSLNKKYQYKKY